MIKTVELQAIQIYYFICPLKDAKDVDSINDNFFRTIDTTLGLSHLTEILPLYLTLRIIELIPFLGPCLKLTTLYYKIKANEFNQ